MQANGRNYWGNFALTLLVLGGTYWACWNRQIPWVSFGVASGVALGWIPVAMALAMLRENTKALGLAYAATPPALPAMPAPSTLRGPTGGTPATTGRFGRAAAPPPAPAPPPADPAERSSLSGDRPSLVGFGGLLAVLRSVFRAIARRGLGAAAAGLLAGLLVGVSGCAGSQGAAPSVGASTSSIVRAAIRWACAAAPVVQDLVDGAGALAASSPAPGSSAVLLVGPAPTNSGGEDLSSTAAVVVSRPADAPPASTPPGSPRPRAIGPHATEAPR